MSRFRSTLTASKTFDPLFKEINKQLEQHGIIVKQGTIVDSSVIDTALRPKGKLKNRVTEDREDKTKVPITKNYAERVNNDGT